MKTKFAALFGYMVLHKRVVLFGFGSSPPTKTAGHPVCCYQPTITRAILPSCDGAFFATFKITVQFTCNPTFLKSIFYDLFLDFKTYFKAPYEPIQSCNVAKTSPGVGQGLFEANI